MKLFTENFKYNNIITVYHGTDSVISKFDIEKSTKWNKFALWFSDNKDLSEMFGSNLYEATIGFNNPHDISGDKWDAIRDEYAKNDNYFDNFKKELLDGGHDCLRITYEPTLFGGFHMPGQVIYAVFSNNSVINFKKI